MKDSEYFKLMESCEEPFGDKADRLVYKVVDMIPEIQREEVKIIKAPIISLLTMNTGSFYNPSNDIIEKRNVELTFGKVFFPLFYKEREQEAAVLHELKGHYLYNKQNLRTNTELMKKIEMEDQMFGLKPRTFPLEELKRRHLDEEICADNAVVEAGYGVDLYSVIKKVKDLFGEANTELAKEEIKARMENLEKKLRMKR